MIWLTIVLLHQYLVKLPVALFLTLPGRTTSQVMAGVWALPMPETAAGDEESILVSIRPSVMISSNQRLMVAQVKHCADTPTIIAVEINI